MSVKFHFFCGFCFWRDTSDTRAGRSLLHPKARSVEVVVRCFCDLRWRGIFFFLISLRREKHL